MLGNLRVLAKALQLRCLHIKSSNVASTFAVSQLSRYYSRPPTQRTDEAINPDEPLKYFGSKAASWRARDTRSGGSDTHLWYQPYVISGSLAVFLIYFCILREESDIDRKLEGNLFDQVSGLEEVQLTVNYKYNKENGLDTTEIEKRLIELGIDVRQLERRLAEEST